MAGRGSTPKNPFQLSGERGKGAPAAPRYAAPLTESEKAKKLEGYFLVPKELWPTVRYSTHVRYILTAEKGGEFRSGGFVLTNPLDIRPDGDGPVKRCLKLQNSFAKVGQNYANWLVAYEDIEYLYIKATAAELVLQGGLQTAASALNDNTARLAEYYKKLDARLSRIESRLDAAAAGRK